MGSASGVVWIGVCKSRRWCVSISRLIAPFLFVSELLAKWRAMKKGLGAPGIS